MELDSTRPKGSKKWGTTQYLGLGNFVANVVRIILEILPG